jgi:hypothetical protein
VQTPAYGEAVEGYSDHGDKDCVLCVFNTRRKGSTGVLPQTPANSSQCWAAPPAPQQQPPPSGAIAGVCPCLLSKLCEHAAKGRVIYTQQCWRLAEGTSPQTVLSTNHLRAC